MLIQDYLRSKSGNVEDILLELQSEFGIKNNCHEDGRTILNYDQIESHVHKTNPLVMECRGLVLDRFNNWKLVARAFPRFFNLGEDMINQEKFIWEGSLCTAKEDGSLLIVYYWNGEWRINTRNSFGEGLVNGGNKTWRQLAEEAIFNTRVKNFLPSRSVRGPISEVLNKKYSYIFELCSPYNKIVRIYKEPKVYLLSAFFGQTEESWLGITQESHRLAIPTPQTFYFNNSDVIVEHIEMLSKQDKTFEGIVVRDKYNRRLKVKSTAYVALHKLKDNDNIFLPKKLIKFVLEGETDEVLIYFPELKETVQEMENTISWNMLAMNILWEKTKGIESQKEFALQVKDTPYSSFLFTARKTGQSPDEVFRNDSDLVLKKFFGG